MQRIRPLLAFFAVIVILAASIHPVVFANDITASKILSLTNESRTTAGLPALKANEALAAAAQAKANDMLQYDYFAHTSPSGVSPWHWLEQAGYAYHYAGENLAINFGSATQEENAWMKSPTHRANILNDRYTEAGVGVAEGKINGESALVTVVMFGQPKVMPPATDEQAVLPEAVQGAADVSQAFSREAHSPFFAGVPNLKTLWDLDNPSTLAWAGIFEVVLMLSALYFFYKDAIEYAALERGLYHTLSEEGLRESDDRQREKKSKPTLIAQLE